MSIEKLRELALSVRNWGRWGPDDEIGTLNYITPESIAAACRLATTGKVFSLGIPLQRKGPQSGNAGALQPHPHHVPRRRRRAERRSRRARDAGLWRRR